MIHPANIGSMLIYYKWAQSLEDPQERADAMLQLLGDVIRELANHYHKDHQLDCTGPETDIGKITLIP